MSDGPPHVRTGPRAPARQLAARATFAVVAALGVAAATSGSAAAETVQAETAEDGLDRTIHDERITESSGLVASTRHPGLLWTHNDKGDRPRFFAVGERGGTLATFWLEGVRAFDWEALAQGRDGDLWVGDIGDNRSVREEVLVHRVAEPTVLESAALVPATYRLRYPDGAHDAEALLVHPDSGRLYVVTKAAYRAGVYAAPVDLRPGEVTTLERVASAPAMVTDGTFLRDGRLVLRTYLDALVGDGVGSEFTVVALPKQRQGESLAAAPDGRSVLVGSEGRHSRIWQVDLP